MPPARTIQFDARRRGRGKRRATLARGLDLDTASRSDAAMPHAPAMGRAAGESSTEVGAVHSRFLRHCFTGAAAINMLG